MLQLPNRTSIRTMHNRIPFLSIIRSLKNRRLQSPASFSERDLDDIPTREEGGVVSDDLAGTGHGFRSRRGGERYRVGEENGESLLEQRFAIFFHLGIEHFGIVIDHSAVGVVKWKTLM